MEKIVLIEDRPDRMAHICKKKGLNLEEYELLKIFTENEIKTVEKDIDTNNFKTLDCFQVVMIHQSAWSQVQLSKLKDYCKRTNKSLVIFSGSVSASHLHLANPPILTIQVDYFYSLRLISFLEDIFKNRTPNLLILQYGNKWKINMLMEARNNLSVFLAKNKGITSLDYYEDAVGIPEALFTMSKELGLDLEWYENGITDNAENILANLKNQLSIIIKNEIFNL
jgi:hypothetical protein